MQTELTFILFMLLICSIASSICMIARSNRKHCQNCVFFTLRKESKRLGNCSLYYDHHFLWEPACKGWKRKPIEQKEAEL